MTYVYIAVGIVFSIASVALLSITLQKKFLKIGLLAATSYLYYGSETGLLAARTINATMSKGDADIFLASVLRIPTDAEELDGEKAEVRKESLLLTMSAEGGQSTASITLKEKLRFIAPDWLSVINRWDTKGAVKLFDKTMIQHLQQNCS